MSDEEPFELDVRDIKVDTYRVGPHITSGTAAEIGVRLTHIPSGLSVQQDGERSLHLNKMVAIERLTALVRAEKEASGIEYEPAVSLGVETGQPARAEHMLSFVDRGVLYRAVVSKDMTSGYVEVARATHQSERKLMTEIELAFFRQLWDKETK